MKNSSSRKFLNPLHIIWGFLFIGFIYVMVPTLQLSSDTDASSKVGVKLLEMTPLTDEVAKSKIGPDAVGAAIPNAVTAVVVYYRGLDTLGEVSVLFLVATAVGMLLGREKVFKESETKPNKVVSHSRTLVLPHFILVGLYITFHGHLTPGGGFQGGVMAAGMALLLILADKRIKEIKALHFLEGLAGTLYVLVAVSGIWLAETFLGQYLPLGKFNTVFSGGVLPIIYIFVGVKVGTEIIGIYQNFQRKGGEHDNH
jgi:multicomponent Na+:H+ antiporter subunit B